MSRLQALVLRGLKRRYEMGLERLFDAELVYRPRMAPIAASGEGRLIGSGDGAVTGEKLSGVIRWTLFEQPGELVCAMNPSVVIDTEDGAEVRVEGRGYARREGRYDRRWRVAATLRFDTRDRRYRWLDGALGFWEGEFDADEYRARYRAYAAPDGARNRFWPRAAESASSNMKEASE